VVAAEHISASRKVGRTPRSRLLTAALQLVCSGMAQLTATYHQEGSQARLRQENALLFHGAMGPDRYEVCRQ
jgi:hypothetical protein